MESQNSRTFLMSFVRFGSLETKGETKGEATTSRAESLASVPSESGVLGVHSPGNTHRFWKRLG